MAEHGHYCPFLNRADARCSTHFQLDHLGAAFEHCFDHYRDCTVYGELLKERQQRRAAAAGGAGTGNASGNGSLAGFWARGGGGGYDGTTAGAASCESPATATTARAAAGTSAVSAPRGGRGGDRTEGASPRLPFTPLTIANRHPQPAPGGAELPPVPGF